MLNTNQKNWHTQNNNCKSAYMTCVQQIKKNTPPEEETRLYNSCKDQCNNGFKNGSDSNKICEYKKITIGGNPRYGQYDCLNAQTYPTSN